MHRIKGCPNPILHQKASFLENKVDNKHVSESICLLLDFLVPCVSVHNMTSHLHSEMLIKSSS